MSRMAIKHQPVWPYVVSGHCFSVNWDSHSDLFKSNWNIKNVFRSFSDNCDAIHSQRSELSPDTNSSAIVLQPDISIESMDGDAELIPGTNNRSQISRNQETVYCFDTRETRTRPCIIHMLLLKNHTNTAVAQTEINIRVVMKMRLKKQMVLHLYYLKILHVYVQKYYMYT